MNMIKSCTIRNLLFLTLAMATVGCGGKPDAEEQTGEEHHEEESSTVELTGNQFRIAGIELSKVERKQISGTIKVNGVLDVPPQQLVSISAPLGGFLKNTSLLQGSRVRKGESIATIENLEFIQIQQDYLEVKSQLELTRADYERQQQLAAENVNSGKTLQQAKTAFDTWHARYNGFAAKLKVLNINTAAVDKGDITSSINLYSPINGYVTQVNVNIGKFVNATDILFEIVDTEHLHAELIVFEKDVRKLKIGQKVRFTLANESKDRMATIYLIGREISKDRTIRIHCHIDNEDTELLPGMYLKAAVETGGADVPALPDEAVIDFQGRKYIFVATEEKADANDHQVSGKEEGMRFSMMEIQVGNSELGYTEIIPPDNFDIETPVVTKSAYALLSKMKNSEGDHH
jgi:cobalt-zinc-cadmium efflux system membrane fusion protein